MINLLEVRNYLFKVLDIDCQGGSFKTPYEVRREVSKLIWDSEEDGTLKRSTQASILIDIIDFVTPDELITPGEFLRDTIMIYRNLVYSGGTSLADIELSSSRFTDIYYGELGLNKVGFKLSGNWSNSCSYLDKVIRGLTICGWDIEKYDAPKRRLILKHKEEVD